MANAEDSITDDKLNDNNAEPSLTVDTDLEQLTTTTDNESEQSFKQSVEQASEKIILATPQPPLIDANPEPAYEPTEQQGTIGNIEAPQTGSLEPAQADSNSLDQVISPETQHIEPVKQVTPQPPLIDAQPEPTYGPQDIKESSQADATTSVNKTSEESTKSLISSDGIEPDNKIPANETADDTYPLDTTPENIETEEKTKEQGSWTETRPQQVSADWLQLTSGEWLRGRIIIMQKENLEFDSDELDELDIEWKKVKYIKSSEPYRLRFDGRIQAVGTIEITQDEVRVATDYDDQTFKRSALQNIASGQETEISKWTNKITFSINVRRGNTDQTDFTSKISAKRRTISSRLLVDYLGTFTEVETIETINNHRLNATVDIFVTRDLFLTPVTTEFFRDPFLNIDSRINIGVAIGYTIINTSETEWDVSGGPAYQESKFVSVPEGEAEEDTTATLLLNTMFETELTSYIDLEGTYNITLGDEKSGGYTHHSILTIETEITDRLDFDVTGVWDHVKSPVQSADGSFPEQDDFRILIGLGYNL